MSAPDDTPFVTIAGPDALDYAEAIEETVASAPHMTGGFTTAQGRRLAEKLQALARLLRSCDDGTW